MCLQVISVKNKEELNTPLFIGNHYIFLPETASTNTYLQSMLREGNPAEGTVVSTGFQTAGRGQVGAVWDSGKDQNIMLSVLLFPGFLNAMNQFQISKAMALAAKDFVITFLPDENIKIKWPNDILVSDKKICGILIENGLKGEQMEYSIIGIGVNINQLFNDKQRTSFKGITGLEYDLRYIEKKLFSCIEARYLQLRNNELKTSADYLEALYGLGEKLRFRDHVKIQDFSGVIVGISPEGKLIIETEGEVRLFNLKEVGLMINHQ